jgi:hypothetical protein
MSSNKNLKYIIITAVSLGITSGIYFLYRLLNKANKEIDSEKKKEEIKEIEKIGNIKKEDEQQNESIQTENKLINIDVLTRIFKRIINYTLEELFIYNDVILKDFNKNGDYIGSIESLRNIKEKDFKIEIIQILSNKNYQLVSSQIQDINLYNQSLDYYLKSNK